jgi:hypothetical protein
MPDKSRGPNMSIKEHQTSLVFLFGVQQARPGKSVEAKIFGYLEDLSTQQDMEAKLGDNPILSSIYFMLRIGRTFEDKRIFEEKVI